MKSLDKFILFIVFTILIISVPYSFNLKSYDITNDKKFLLICGFENFNNFYIRVDILERFFLKIIKNTKDGIFKIDSDMINLIGCSKENFFELLKLMQYKQKKIDNNEECFEYQPNYIKKHNKKSKRKNETGPFDKLSELRFR